MPFKNRKKSFSKSIETYNDVENIASNIRSKITIPIDYYFCLFPHREVIGDTRTFIAAQKFKKILQLGQNRQAKNVPWFSMTDVSKILSKLSLNENIFIPRLLFLRSVNYHKLCTID